jgi:hypothetical protein
MSSSAEEGRALMLKWITSRNPRSVVDVGAGSGTYGKALRAAMPARDPYMIGVEVWHPYISHFGLPSIYDLVLHRDVRSLPLDEWPRTDIVILGDVLEHMTEADAVRVWNLARAAARKAVYLSIPIVHYPQGAEEGNPFETHVVDDWTHERVLATFPGITWHWQGTVVGRYEAETPYSADEVAHLRSAARNLITGPVTGSVVQAGDIHGGLSL